MRTVEEMLDEIENANNGEGPDPIGSYDAAPLRSIMDLVEERSDVAARLRAAVDVAREAGASWGAIGVCLGVSKQAAAKKYKVAA